MIVKFKKTFKKIIFNRSIKKGMTLMELMVASLVLTIGVVALANSFKYIHYAIQASKNKTAAVNFAQEKMQILKQKSYYNIVPTTAPLYLTEFTPSVPYDNYFFPPENILGGTNYKRYVYVQVVKEDSGNIVVLPPTTPDTGMRMITITVVWSHKGAKKFQIKSIVSNPDTVMANCIIQGIVQDSFTFSPVEDALINIAENLGFRDTTDVFGNYSININPGNYAVSVFARGYFPMVKSISITANQTQTHDFDLDKMGTGIVEGYPWVRDHLVMSQVVGSTESAGFKQEYVELFNPTTYTWTVDGVIGLKFQRADDASKKTIKLTYNNVSIPSNGFYLFANTAVVNAYGASVAADAVWSNTNNVADFPYFAVDDNVIPTSDLVGEGGAALELYEIATGRILDRLGWDKSGAGKTAPFSEGVALPENIGLQVSEVYTRISSTDGFSVSYTPAYDSNDNNTDFVNRNPLDLAPRNSLTALGTTISGTPAEGAMVSCSDGLSISTTSYLVGNPPYAEFNLIDVATGTWTVSITSSQYSLVDDTVTIVSTGDIYAFPSTSTFFNTAITWGYVTGKVTDIFYNPITPAITITDYADSTIADISDGRYTLLVSTGYSTITANLNNQEADYVSISSQNVFVELGEIKSGLDFVLYQGAMISGFITRDGINALPGVTVTVLDSNNASIDQQTSANDGKFITNTISTGTYTLAPIIDSRETVSPSTYPITLSLPGTTIFSTTFTVSNALGYIRGSVSYQGEPIKTGVLMVVTTTTLTGSPPAPPTLDYSSLTGPPFYLASSHEDGTYIIEARETTGNLYNVYAYYSIPGDISCAIISSSTVNVQVLAGQETTGVNFSW